MSNPKVICTGVKSHRPRTLAKFSTTPTSFVIQRDDSVGMWTEGHPDASTQRFRFVCTACRRDMRFSGTDLFTYLTADTGTKHKDVSVLAAMLSR